MDRRAFNKLAGVAAVGAFSVGPLASEAQRPPIPASVKENTAEPSPLSPDQIVIEDEHTLIAIDPNSGALTRFYRKSTRWAIQQRPELAISFRLLVPLPNRQDNFVLGQKQRASEVSKLSDRQVQIKWKNLLSEHGGVLPISFTSLVTLSNGVVKFESTLDNDSELSVQTIDYPYFGDLASPTHDTPLYSEHMWYDNLVGDELYPTFNNEKGYWGVDFPTKTIDSKQSLFCLIQGLHQGMYVGMHDASQPYLLQFTFEQHPGVVQSLNSSVPEQAEIGGIPVHLEFRICHFLYSHPHSTRKLAPIVMHCYSGDWHAGVDIYREWRNTWFKKPHIADWVKDVHSWQQLQINTPVQDYSIPYSRLKPYIDECVANNVRAIQLVGWNIEGQDGGDPCLDTDPGLGTWDQLHDAITYAQSKGVKMIMFGKLSWADMTTPWFRDTYHKFACTDPYGIPYQTGGYSYITPVQLAAINNHRREIMDFLSQEYRDLATKQFKKILALGAAGWLYDEVCHHGPVEYSFSPDHGYESPGYIYAGDMPMGRQLRDAANKVSDDFIFAGEAPQDWLLQFYPVSYFRFGGGSRPVARYIDPYAPMVAAVTGFDDREKLNLILMYRYIISYEPYNFKGYLEDFPLTLSYGKKIDDLRRRYKAYIWDGEFRDGFGATVTADGACRHSVFVAKSGKRAVVIVNEEPKRAISARLSMPNPGRLVMASPEHPDSRATGKLVQIPARSLVVVMEA